MYPQLLTRAQLADSSSDPIQQTRDDQPMLVQCWPIVFDAGSTLCQHCLIASCSLGCLKYKYRCDHGTWFLVLCIYSRHLDHRWLDITDGIPVNERRLSMILLGQRRRRWINNKPALDQSLVCVVMLQHYIYQLMSQVINPLAASAAYIRVFIFY